MPSNLPPFRPTKTGNPQDLALSLARLNKRIDMLKKYAETEIEALKAASALGFESTQEENEDNGSN